MLIMWTGAGPVVFMIGIVVCLFTNIITSRVFEESNYFQKHLWAQVTALVITGVTCWFLGRYMHSRPSQLVIDKTTGQEVEQKPSHDFMFIKVEYWGVIYLVAAVVLVVVSFAR
jgi:hypothetical protein